MRPVTIFAVTLRITENAISDSTRSPITTTSPRFRAAVSESASTAEPYAATARPVAHPPIV